MRKYQALWEQIKLYGKADISASASLHPRIMRAVRKEKNKDMGWVYEQLEQKRKYKLKHIIEGAKLTFILQDVTPTLYKL